jgi:hypothetical protein
MNTPTSKTRRERGATVDGATAGQSLQPERAFVVQLRGGPATSPSGLQGRVEHVVSGEALRFASTAEMIEFLTRSSEP